MQARGQGDGELLISEVLDGYTIFVDVRTDDGEDAGELFVEMLEGMGARVRVSSLQLALFC